MSACIAVNRRLCESDLNSLYNKKNTAKTFVRHIDKQIKTCTIKIENSYRHNGEIFALPPYIYIIFILVRHADKQNAKFIGNNLKQLLPQ